MKQRNKDLTKILIFIVRFTFKSESFSMILLFVWINRPLVHPFLYHEFIFNEIFLENIIIAFILSYM